MDVKLWHEVNGDETLALDWKLTEDSHVWEIGGYEGRWAQQIWDKFHCHVTIFEPQLWAVVRMKVRFAGNDKMDIRPYGLWTEDTVLPIGEFETDGASVVPEKMAIARQFGEGKFRDFYHEVYNFPHDIDLCLMNIEGAEYTLLPLFMGSGIMPRFNQFWCQFHPMDGDDHRADEIFASLEQSHEMLWNCYPTAVAWKRK